MHHICMSCHHLQCYLAITTGGGDDGLETLPPSRPHSYRVRIWDGQSLVQELTTVPPANVSSQPYSTVPVSQPSSVTNKAASRVQITL